MCYLCKAFRLPDRRIHWHVIGVMMTEAVQGLPWETCHSLCAHRCQQLVIQVYCTVLLKQVYFFQMHSQLICHSSLMSLREVFFVRLQADLCLCCLPLWWMGGWLDGWMDGWMEGGREGGCILWSHPNFPAKHFLTLDYSWRVNISETSYMWDKNYMLLLNATFTRQNVD